MAKRNKERKEGTASGTNSGKSASGKYPLGLRRRDSKGLELAPKSLRKLGKHYLKDCSEDQLKRSGIIR